MERDAFVDGALEVVVSRTFEPRPPTGTTLDVWHDAAGWAQRFWRIVEDHMELEPEVRTFAGEAARAVGALAARVRPPPVPPPPAGEGAARSRRP